MSSANSQPIPSGQHILPTPFGLLQSSIDPLRDPLTKEQTEEAMKDKVVRYPQNLKTTDDPALQGQSHGILTFLLLSEPKKTKHGKNVYGYVKLRGNFSDDANATARCGTIIKEIDSKSVNRICQVGQYVPITEDSIFVKDQLDVRMSEEEHHIRDQAVKDREAEARKVAREIREREEELKRSGDVYDDPTSLSYYTMKRVTDLKLMEMIEQKERELVSLRDKIITVRTELKNLDKSHPQYNDEWVEEYNKKRRPVGLPDFRPSSKLFEEYNNWTNPNQS